MSFLFANISKKTPSDLNRENISVRRPIQAEYYSILKNFSAVLNDVGDHYQKQL